MKILVTGATGYIGKRLIPLLANSDHQVVCAVRDKLRADKSYAEDDTIDVAFYLIHSMSNSSKDFESLEERCAVNFKNQLEKTNVKQVIYLSGITNEENLSKH
jgi:uncharacterized protein YbjT (DUF2867 family)